MYFDFGSLMALILIVLIAFGAWFWSDSLLARERMTGTCARLCHELNLQFLDETVALARLRLSRSAAGWPEFRRLYHFEFSRSGADRWPGRAQLAGRRVESVQLESPEGVIILAGAQPLSAAQVHLQSPADPPREQTRSH